MLYYWYDVMTGIVYDYDLHYPVGKVKKIDNIPVKLDIDTYEIEGLFIPTLISDTEAQVPGSLPLGWAIHYFENSLDEFT